MQVQWDCHMHMVLDGENWREAIRRHSQGPDMDYIRSVLAEYKRQGFTYLRDGGDRWGVGKAARSVASEYGITYRTPLAPLCLEGNYGSFIGECYVNLEEYIQLVRKIRAAGGDFIKIMISGLMDFDRFGVLTQEGLPKKLIRELVAVAHGEGMAVMAHANGAETIAIAAGAGVDSVEHGAYADEKALDAMGQAGTVWVPTLSTIGNLRGTGRFHETAVEKILESAMCNVRDFAAMGGSIAPGSDAGAWAVPHGCCTEYGLLREALGESAEEILTAGAGQIQSKF